MNASYGGPAQGIRNIVPALAKFGVYNEVVSLDESNSTFHTEDNFAIHTLGHIDNIWWYSPKLVPWLVENLARFDLVIAHGLWRYTNYAIWEAFKIYDRKIKGTRVNTPRPFFFIMPHGMLDPYFQLTKGRKFKAFRNEIYYKLISQKILEDCDGLLFTCKEELLLARQTFKNYRPSRELNIGYGIEAPPACNISMISSFLAKFRQTSERPYLLFFSRIHEKKGLLELVKRYIEIVRQTRNGSMATVGEEQKIFPDLVIAGPGIDTQYGKKVLKFVSEYSELRERIVFTGMLTGDAKWGALYGCEAFILPSHQENFGIAVVEALACGKPVLVSNQVNIWREIEEGGGGIIADDTEEGVSHLLNGWLSLSVEKKKAMGKKARLIFEKTFTIGPVAQRSISTFENYVSKTNSQSSKRRVLHVLQSMDPKMGGVCQAVRTIIRGLSDHDVNNEVASLDWWGSDLPDDPFPTHMLGPGIGPWKYSSRLYRWLVKNLSRFDTVIVHGMWLYYAHAVESAVAEHNKTRKKKEKINLILMPHGMLDPYFQKAKERRLKAIRNWVYYKLVQKNIVNKADTLFFTCQSEKMLASTAFSPYNPKNEIVVGLGVELPPPYKPSMKSAFSSICPEVRENTYLLFLSRIHPKKGVDMLIRVYIELVKKGVINADVKLVVAGPGLETSYGGFIKKLASESALFAKNIVFPGMLGGEAKWGAFYGCQLFVLPSHQENFGIAAVEAMACGVPILITNQVNIWKEIEEMGGGLVANDTEAALKDMLVKWSTLRDEEKRQMSIKATKTYKRYFAIEGTSRLFFDSLDTDKSCTADICSENQILIN
jgi:glycosyltransferase involved in cell wall biosynthesis